MKQSETNRILGYPPDARLLIVNADDFGMYQAANEAILGAFKGGIVSSTSLMVPCPFGSGAMQLLKKNPDLDFGVHLTIICDLSNSKWGALNPKDKVPSLIDETGHFYSLEAMPELLARAKLDEVEMEFRAQIEAVLAEGLKPSHLDWHCLHHGGRADIYELTLELAKEFGLALRVDDPALIAGLQNEGLPTDEHPLLDSFSLKIADKSAAYIRLLRELPVGLSEWAVHPGLDNAEAQAIDPGGWQVRHTDYLSMISTEIRDIIQQEGIIVLNYKPLQTFWQDV